MGFTDKLMQFNLTRQEAIIYKTLIKEGNLTGYEVAKIAKISRSNTYSALASLVDKGGAYVVKENVTHYSALPVEEFCNNKIRHMKKLMEELKNEAPKQNKEIDYYITIKSDKHIINKMKNLIESTEERLYISASNEIIGFVINEIRNIKCKNIKIVIITDKILENNDDFKVYLSEKSQNQIRLIIDSKEVLTGSVCEGDYSACVYSKNINLVNLIKESIKNEIKVIELVSNNK